MNIDQNGPSARRSNRIRNNILLFSFLATCICIAIYQASQTDSARINDAMFQTVPKSAFLPFWQLSPDAHVLMIYALPTGGDLRSKISSRFKVSESDNYDLVLKLSYPILPGRITTTDLSTRLSADLVALENGEPTSVAVEAKTLPTTASDLMEIITTYGFILQFTLTGILAVPVLPLLLVGAIMLIRGKYPFSYYCLLFAFLVLAGWYVTRGSGEIQRKWEDTPFAVIMDSIDNYKADPGTKDTFKGPQRIQTDSIVLLAGNTQEGSVVNLLIARRTGK